MSAPVLFLTAWVGGMAIGLVSKPRRPDTRRVATGVASVFAVGAVMPVGVLLYAFFPDWSLMYAAHPHHVPTMVTGFLLAFGYALAPVLGCAGGRAAEARGRRWSLSLFGGSLGLTGVVVFWGWRRLTTVTYFETFHYGAGVRLPLFESALLVPLSLSMVVLWCVFAFAVLHLRRNLQRIDPSRMPFRFRG